MHQQNCQSFFTTITLKEEGEEEKKQKKEAEDIICYRFLSQCGSSSPSQLQLQLQSITTAI